MSDLAIRPLEAEAPPEVRRRAGFRGRLLVLLLQIAVVGLFLAIWQIAVSSGLIDKFWVSSPEDIVKRLWQFRNTVGSTIPGGIWSHVVATFQEALVGLAIGSTSGIVIGLILGQWRLLAEALHPLLNLANTLPRVALGPLFILWFGIGQTSKMTLVFTVVVFILIFNTYAGVLTVDRELVAVAHLLGAKWYHVLWKITLPWCVPWIIAGMRIALAWSLGAAVVGEYLGAREGVGYLIFTFSNILDNTGVLAGCVVLLIMSWVMFGVLTVIEKRLLRWRVHT
ncbi:MAG: sulfonate transport system permease protein [Gaiellaceae bacterium]|nr:sulfonate transport system permease protein [Gaiellaceae bacterium]